MQGSTRQVIYTNDIDPISVDKKKKKKKPVPPTMVNGVTIHTTDDILLKQKKPKKKMPKKVKEPEMHHYHDSIWSGSDDNERQKIREFWAELSEPQRRTLVKVEKEAVLKKMKEQQRQTCSCHVCGRKRIVIEEELEILYDAYYEELEHMANDHPLDRRYFANPRYLNEVDDIEDEDYESDDSGVMEFGGSLRVNGGILTVADDFLKNDGKRFLDLMENLARKKTSEEYESQNNDPSWDEEFDEDDEEDYEDDEEEDEHLNEQQRIEDGRRMFQIFAAKMFEQRVLTAYREKLAAERQEKFLQELEEEEKEKERKDRIKQESREKKKQLKKQQKDAQKQKDDDLELLQQKEEEELERQRLELEIAYFLMNSSEAKEAEEKEQQRLEEERLLELRELAKKKEKSKAPVEETKKVKKSEKAAKPKVQPPVEDKKGPLPRFVHPLPQKPAAVPVVVRKIVKQSQEDEEAEEIKPAPSPITPQDRMPLVSQERVFAPPSQSDPNVQPLRKPLVSTIPQEPNHSVPQRMSFVPSTLPQDMNRMAQSLNMNHQTPQNGNAFNHHVPLPQNGIHQVPLPPHGMNTMETNRQRTLAQVDPILTSAQPLPQPMAYALSNIWGNPVPSQSFAPRNPSTTYQSMSPGYSQDPNWMMDDRLRSHSEIEAPRLVDPFRQGPWGPPERPSDSTLPLPPGLSNAPFRRPDSFNFTKPGAPANFPNPTLSTAPGFWSVPQSAYEMLPPHLLDELDLRQDNYQDPLASFSSLDLNPQKSSRMRWDSLSK